MCRIAGRLGPEPLSLSALEEMAAAIDNRGPDARGLWQVHPTAGLAVELFHSRLAILGLSTAAAQPSHSACGRYVLVFNGEIYSQQPL
jgi:asparagine synthase (glutamine-hydrolysing)